MITRERLLDVSDLPPPEPLEQALVALDTLSPGEYLHMLHRREPYLLYPILEQRGFAHATVQARQGVLEIFVWRQGDASAEAAVRQVTHQTRNLPYI